jgi:chromate transporter
VVGILGAALYDPVFVGAVADTRDFALASASFFALTVRRIPPWIIVMTLVAASVALRAF